MKDFKEGGYATVIKERRRGELFDSGETFRIEKEEGESLYVMYPHSYVKKDRCRPATPKEIEGVKRGE